MIDLVLKKSKERSLLRRHPWVYDTAVQKVVLDSKKTAPASGETVRVVSFDGRFLAWAAYSPESTIRARCWSFKEEEVIDASWFERKLRHAVEARACLRDRTSAVRLVFGEADGLPGLIVDQYADCLVTQFQSAGVEAHRELIADLLMEITGAKTIFDRSDAATRQREGLPIRSELLRGEEPPAAIEVVEDGVRYGVDVRVGHKTGFYVDQRESRLTAQKVAEEFRRVHGRGMRALNCFAIRAASLLHSSRAVRPKSSPLTPLRRPSTWPPPMPGVMVLRVTAPSLSARTSSRICASFVMRAKSSIW